MHPYDHARSSARIHGGVWQDYFALHAWFDVTKSLLCRFTHRALRHHLEGAAEDLAEASVMRFGGNPSVFLPLHRWFLATANWTEGNEHLAFRHHAFGIFEAEGRFGPIIHQTDGRMIPTRVVAERHVQEVLGRVPSATEFLRRIKGERWMLQATSPRKLGLDAPATAVAREKSDATA